MALIWSDGRRLAVEYGHIDTDIFSAEPLEIPVGLRGSGGVRVEPQIPPDAGGGGVREAPRTRPFR